MEYGYAGLRALAKASGCASNVLTPVAPDRLSPQLTARENGRIGLGGRELSKTALFQWIAAIIFINQLFDVIKESSSLSLADLVTNLVAIGIFQYLAWYTVFRLLAASNHTQPASRRDWLVAVAVCLLLFIPTGRVIWVSASCAGLYVLVFNGGERQLRAAGVVLVALATQEFWGHLLFELIASPLLHAETAVVGMLLQTLQSGAVWRDNIVTGQSGDGIIIQPYCSSFHNLSLALLCWVTIVHLKGGSLGLRDLAMGAAIGAAMVALNVARLLLMATSIDWYRYWHDGAGAQIFAVGASLLVLLLSVYAAPRRAPA